jgi:type II secretory pathway component PulC
MESEDDSGMIELEPVVSDNEIPENIFGVSDVVVAGNEESMGSIVDDGSVVPMDDESVFHIDELE